MRHKENSERLEWLQIHVDCTSLGNIGDCEAQKQRLSFISFVTI